MSFLCNKSEALFAKDCLMKIGYKVTYGYRRNPLQQPNQQSRNLWADLQLQAAPNTAPHVAPYSDLSKNDAQHNETDVHGDVLDDDNNNVGLLSSRLASIW